jgi:hypothetical protein
MLYPLIPVSSSTNQRTILENSLFLVQWNTNEAPLNVLIFRALQSFKDSEMPSTQEELDQRFAYESQWSDNDPLHIYAKFLQIPIYVYPNHLDSKPINHGDKYRLLSANAIYMLRDDSSDLYHSIHKKKQVDVDLI